MTQAFLWGLVATSSLIVGGILGLAVNFRHRTLGMIMGFGAGVLISAVAYELTADAVREAHGTGIPAVGFLVGAMTFFGLDRLIGRIGGGDRKTIEPTQSGNLVVPLLLAIILDGIPESAVVGIGIRESGSVSLAMLAAVFISNLPEAIVGTSGMKSAKRPGWAILLLWTTIAVACAFTSAAGFALLGDASPLSLSFVKMFAGGAILMMLANTMMPEAFHHGGKLAGVFTVLGFMVSVGIIVLEHQV